MLKLLKSNSTLLAGLAGLFGASLAYASCWQNPLLAAGLAAWTGTWCWVYAQAKCQDAL
jgi:hypothetical protein